ncbi:MAG: YIP1 family protein [Planctomycetes bacterium]|nr:YIP1 family protein [Planctomycetota bacterium]
MPEEFDSNEEVFQCSECFEEIEAPSSWRGKRVKCPHCDAELRLPTSGGKASKEEDRRRNSHLDEIAGDGESAEPRRATEVEREIYREDGYEKDPSVPFPFNDPKLSLAERFKTTLKRTISDPGETYFLVGERSTIGSSVKFWFLCSLVGVVLIPITQLAFSLTPMQDQRQEQLDQMLGELSRTLGENHPFYQLMEQMIDPSAGFLVGLVVFGLIAQVLSLFLSSMIVHVCGLMWGCAAGRLEATIMVMFYSAGVIALIQAILSAINVIITVATISTVPIVSIGFSMLIGIGILAYSIYLLVVTLSSAHDSTPGRALLTLATPLMVCCICGCLSMFMPALLLGASRG